TFSDAATTPIDDGTGVFAIVDQVTVSGRVLEQMTFTVSGVAGGVACGTGETASANLTTTANTVPFGNYASGTPRIGCQTVSTSTNAQGGYTTTLRQWTGLGVASPVGAMCRQTATN